MTTISSNTRVQQTGSVVKLSTQWFTYKSLHITLVKYGFVSRLVTLRFAASRILETTETDSSFQSIYNTVYVQSTSSDPTVLSNNTAMNNIP